MKLNTLLLVEGRWGKNVDDAFVRLVLVSTGKQLASKDGGDDCRDQHGQRWQKSEEDDERKPFLHSMTLREKEDREDREEESEADGWNGRDDGEDLGRLKELLLFHANPCNGNAA